MRTKKLSTVVVVLFAVSIVAGLALAAGSYKLGYRLQKGQRLKYQTNVKVDQSMEMMGQEMTTAIESASLLNVEVENVDKDGNTTIVLAVDSFSTHIKNSQIDTTFKNPEGLVGKRMRQVISGHGKKISSAVIDSVKLAGMLAQLGGQQSSLNLIELPDHEVKPGDTWSVSKTDTMKQGADGKAIVSPNHTYTIGAEVDTLGYHCIRISYTGTVSVKGEGKNMGMNYFAEGEGPSSGTVYFAPKEGLLIAAINNSDIEMTIALTGQMSMTIPQSTSTRTAVTLVK